MSRIGKQPIPVSPDVTVTINDHHVSIKGPKGTLEAETHPHVNLKNEDGHLTVSVAKPDNQDDRALWGLWRMLVSNMVEGVTKGFEKKLEINGVGYKAAAAGQKLTLNLGFSHAIEFEVPTGVTATVDKNVVTVAGIDKQLVGATAAKIRSFKKPEPYKGKGIKYSDEVIRRKAGKVVKAAGAK